MHVDPGALEGNNVYGDHHRDFSEKCKMGGHGLLAAQALEM